jgi:Carbohydrate binding domain
MRGLINPSTAGWTGNIATLPAGYRPAAIILGNPPMAADSNGLVNAMVTPRVDAYPNGNLFFAISFDGGAQNASSNSNTGPGEWLSLDNYSFPAASNSMAWTRLTNPTYWTPYSVGNNDYWLNAGATLSQSTQSQTGADSLQVQTSGSVAGTGAEYVLPGSYTAGVPYMVSMWVKGAAGGEALQMNVGSPGADRATTTYVTLTTGWQLIGTTWTPTATEDAPSVVINTTAAHAYTFYVDNVMAVATGNPNRVTNPSFETNLTGWAPGVTGDYFENSGATITQVSSQHQDGANAMQVTTVGNYSGVEYQLSGTFTAGTTYTLKMYLKGNAGGEPVQVYLGAQSADYAGALPQPTLTLTTGWQQATINWTPTATETNPKVAILARLTSVTFFVDNVSVGTSNPNWVTNPSFETNLTGWAPGVTGDRYEWSGATITQVSSQHEAGADAMQVTTGSGGYTGVEYPLSGTFNAGTTYTLTMWLKGNSGGEPTQEYLGAQTDSYASASPTLTTSWQQITMNWTPSVTETHAEIAIRTISAVSTFFVDNVSLVVTGLGTPGPTSIFTYQWQNCDGFGANCANAPGATASTDTLAWSDYQPFMPNTTMRSVVTACNFAACTPASSAQTGVITGYSPTNTAVPTISGTAVVGGVMTVNNNGTWTNNTNTSYAYQWEDCNASGGACSTTPIVGANSSSYTLAWADLGHTVRALVTLGNPVLGPCPLQGLGPLCTTATSAQAPTGGATVADYPPTVGPLSVVQNVTPVAVNQWVTGAKGTLTVSATVTANGGSGVNPNGVVLQYTHVASPDVWPATNATNTASSGTVACVAAGNTYNCTLTLNGTTALSDGPVDLRIQAADNAPSNPPNGVTNSATFGVGVDNTPPIDTTTILTGAKNSTPVIATVSGSDVSSGVDHVSYQIDNNSVVTTVSGVKTAIASITGEGVHTLKTQIFDVAGNASGTGGGSWTSQTFTIDMTAPTLTVTNPNGSTWTNTNQSAVIAAVDPTVSGAPSGIAGVYYRYHNSDASHYTDLPAGIPTCPTGAPTPVCNDLADSGLVTNASNSPTFSPTETFSNEGLRTIDFWAVDAAGNLSTIRSITVQIDKTAPALPVISGIANGALAKDQVKLTIPTSDVALPGAPNGSGIALGHLQACDASTDATKCATGSPGWGDGQGNTAGDITQPSGTSTPTTTPCAYNTPQATAGVFSCILDTTSFANGNYYLRAVVSDLATNSTTGPAVQAVRLRNSGFCPIVGSLPVVN